MCEYLSFLYAKDGRIIVHPLSDAHKDVYPLALAMGYAEEELEPCEYVPADPQNPFGEYILRASFLPEWNVDCQALRARLDKIVQSFIITPGYETVFTQRVLVRPGEDLSETLFYNCNFIHIGKKSSLGGINDCTGEICAPGSCILRVNNCILYDMCAQQVALINNSVIKRLSCVEIGKICNSFIATNAHFKEATLSVVIGTPRYGNKVDSIFINGECAYRASQTQT